MTPPHHPPHCDSTSAHQRLRILNGHLFPSSTSTAADSHHRINRNHTNSSASNHHRDSNNNNTTIISSIPQHNESFHNWAEIHSCTPQKMFYPTSEQQICQIIKEAKKCGKKVKVCGSGHSPSDIAMCDENGALDEPRNEDWWMMHLSKFTGIMDCSQKSLKRHKRRFLRVDAQHSHPHTPHFVRVRGGTTLDQMNDHLEKEGYCLSSLGSISEQTISGAISTGTHGTGIQFGNLCSMVQSMRIVDANGEVHVANRPDDLWSAAVCGMGAVGIITELTFRVEPLFKLYAIQKPMPLQEVLGQLDDLITSAEHFRFWWFPHTDNCISWSANRIDVQTKSTHEIRSALETMYESMKDKWIGYHLFELTLYIGRHFPSLVPTINRLYYYTLFSEAKSHIDTSYKVFNFDCRFKQYVNEWAIPIENTREAIQRLKAMIEKNNYKVHLPVEVRFVKRDDIWMSPCYQRDVCYIGIIMYRPYGKTVPYEKYFNDFEKLMMQMDGRPHWAKEFSLRKQDFEKMYPKFHDFNRVRLQMDPDGMFMNKYLRRVLDEDEVKEGGEGSEGM